MTRSFAARRKRTRRAEAGGAVPAAAPDRSHGSSAGAVRRLRALWRKRTLRIAGLAAVSTLLAACSYAGDFGRPRVLPFADLTSPPRPDIVTSALPPSPFPLNDEERELRALAENLLAHPYERFRAHALPVAGLAYTADDYAAFLFNEFDSAAARYARLIDDTRNDSMRIEPFFAVARRVADLDGKRERSLQVLAQPSAAEVSAARLRVHENMALMQEVQRTLQERAAMYRFTLERLVVAVPSPLAAEAERARLELERRVAAIQVVAPARARVAK